MAGKDVLSKHSVWATVSAFTALLVVLTSCSQEKASNSPATKTGESPKRANISVMIFDRGQIPQDKGNYELNRWTKWINENGPAQAAFVPIPRVKPEEKLNVLFASGNAPDLVMDFAVENMHNFYEQKQLLPLDDLIAKHSNTYKQVMEKYPILKKLGTKPDGKLYQFGVLRGLKPNLMILVRADWLKKLNMPVPQTTDELYAVAKAFAEKDPDGNGKKDTFGLSLAGSTNGVVNNMFQNVGLIVENGRLVRDWERYRAALEFKKRLYDEGIVDKDFLADTNGQKAQKDWTTGKLGIFVAQYNQTSSYSSFESLKKNVPDAEVAVIALPKSEFGQFAPDVSAPVNITAGINVKAKDPAAIVKFVDFMNEESTIQTLKYGIEGEHYKKDAKGCPVPIDSKKSVNEVYWNQDYYQLLGSQLFLEKCNGPEYRFNPDKPTEKLWIDILKQSETLYLNPKSPIPYFTHQVFKPQLPSDLTMIEKSVDLDSIVSKAIVAGASYTVLQAIKDAQMAWEKAGGKQVDEWYGKWYTEHKNNAVLAKDIYDIK